MAQQTNPQLVQGPAWRPDIVVRLGLDGPRERRLADFCGRWRVTELELFGSVLRSDFGPKSDVDLLVTFHPAAEWGLIEHAAMEEELAGLLGRPSTSLPVGPSSAAPIRSGGPRSSALLYPC